jgi:glucosamine-6-phosphate deaminase
MKIHIFETRQAMAQAAAQAAADRLRALIAERGTATIVLATGTSQQEMLAALAASPNIAWHKIAAYHLDEYIGLPLTHPASLRLFLWQRFVRHLPVPLRAMHYLDGQEDAAAECQRMGRMVAAQPIDLALVGIGENGHLAFNDPPADRQTREPFLVVHLDEACRRQQVAEGWFATLAEVPATAITMSIHRLMTSESIICTVPDSRKAEAVSRSVNGPVTPAVPASVLQEHQDVSLFLDAAAASRLDTP